MKDTSAAPPLEVGLLALPETTPATLYGLYEVFSSVGVAWSELTGEPAGTAPVSVRILSESGGTLVSSAGIPIAPHAAIGDVERVDVVIASDVAVPLDSDVRGRWPAAVSWLRQRYASGATVCSVCTGSLVLAEAGLLDGIEATTHWAAASLFRVHYPRVRLKPERVLVHGGEDGRIVTSGGAASWEDLSLFLIARFCGEAEAVRISKIFVFGDRSEGQLPYAAMRRSDRHEDAAIAACQAWIADHYNAPNPVGAMVRRSGLAERTFRRRFRAATGYAPVDYVQTLRVEEAKQMLERSETPTDTVAHAVGYEDTAFFRRLFKRKTGLTPARYRQRFRSIVPKIGARLRPAGGEASPVAGRR